MELSIHANQDEPEKAQYYEGSIQVASERNVKAPAHQTPANYMEKSEHIVHALVANSAEALAVVNKDGKILYSSVSSQHIVGVSSEQLKGKHISEFIHPDDRRQVGKYLAALIKNPGKPLPFLFRTPQHRWKLALDQGQSNQPPE